MAGAPAACGASGLPGLVSRSSPAPWSRSDGPGINVLELLLLHFFLAVSAHLQVVQEDLVGSQRPEKLQPLHQPDGDVLGGKVQALHADGEALLALTRS